MKPTRRPGLWHFPGHESFGGWLCPVVLCLSGGSGPPWRPESGTGRSSHGGPQQRTPSGGRSKTSGALRAASTGTHRCGGSHGVHSKHEEVQRSLGLSDGCLFKRFLNFVWTMFQCQFALLPRVIACDCMHVYHHVLFFHLSLSLSMYCIHHITWV